MKAAALVAPGEFKYLPDYFDIPRPQPGEVLIKVEASCIVASDKHTMSGKYSKFINYKYPMILGFEGSGIVIENGGGLLGWRLVGKRVSFIKPSANPTDFTQQGSFAEYIITSSMSCNPLTDDISFDQGANNFVNPMTTLGLMDYCKWNGVIAGAQTGAMSQCGRYLDKLFRDRGIPMINIVRKQDQIEQLKTEYGCQYVLNSESPNFQQELNEMCKTLKVNVIIDCVAGSMQIAQFFEKPSTKYNMYCLGLNQIICSGKMLRSFHFYCPIGLSKNISGSLLDYLNRLTHLDQNKNSQNLLDFTRFKKHMIIILNIQVKEKF
ncbi:zinc-binding dehydrogenase family protein [Stylonychia lemnae]|uniref:Zinc-binding dehydrogenase family protein n=1 Tax=Stylonychia lemnae TaxID=5949 RepID=A0A078B5A8_STYLE|nr:zinc-binding dehydrogenase family protein [Stylonychia lemnae]|eukprot:CDW88723.1 zinc-binding dehydrogenase family protein [Stylonychia lemnae]